MTTLQQLHEIVLSRRVPANIFDILGEAAVALRALAEEVEVSKGMLGAITAEIAALRAAPVEPAPDDMTDKALAWDVVALKNARIAKLEGAARPLLDQFDRYLNSGLSHYDAHNMLVQYKLWDALRRALASDGEGEG